jgi:site-specific DNA-methyltransferase (adenine-specific)
VRTPYYQDAHVTLYHGIFEDHLNELRAASAAAIVTDPPYGDTALKWDIWPEGWPAIAADLATTMWMFGSFRMFFEHASEFNRWTLSQDIIWEKHNGSNLHADRFRRVHEQAVMFYQGAWSNIYNAPPRTPDAIARRVRRQTKPAHLNGVNPSLYTTTAGDDRLMRSVIRLRSMHGNADNETQKPVDLLGLFIECSVPPGGAVVDPFAGAGSTGLAARRLGRTAVLVEMRESQCEKAARRFQNDTALPLFPTLEGGDAA